MKIGDERSLDPVGGRHLHGERGPHARDAASVLGRLRSLIREARDGELFAPAGGQGERFARLHRVSSDAAVAAARKGSDVRLRNLHGDRSAVNNVHSLHQHIRAAQPDPREPEPDVGDDLRAPRLLRDVNLDRIRRPGESGALERGKVVPDAHVRVVLSNLIGLEREQAEVDGLAGFEAGGIPPVAHQRGGTLARTRLSFHGDVAALKDKAGGPWRVVLTRDVQVSGRYRSRIDVALHLRDRFLRRGDEGHDANADDLIAQRVCRDDAVAGAPAVELHRAKIDHAVLVQDPLALTLALWLRL